MVKMETKTLKPYFVVIGLMILTSLALAFTIDVKVTNQAGIRMELPDQVGDWVGRDLRFCQNPLCLREFKTDELSDLEKCPVCGSELSTMTRSENDLLPSDTEILKKEYRNSKGRTLFVSVVLSGKERVSIHRPQVCLVGQGNEIINSTIVPVTFKERKPLDVMSLEMIRRFRDSEGEAKELPTYFAYWFVGQGRETPYHVQRMIWMATDRIFRNVSHRWAYIAITGIRDEQSEKYKEELQDFVSELYPQVAL